MPDYFRQSDQGLLVENVSLARIAQEFGTPTYVYSQSAIEEAYKSLTGALHPLGVDVYYAAKANSSQAILALFNKLGAGLDIVSEGELRAALKAGFSASKVVFAGVGKKAGEIEFALDQGIQQFNVESLPELQQINKIAKERGLIAPVSLRINPDVSPDTHAKISTGQATSKFGVDPGTLHHIAEHLDHFDAVDIHGLAMHIGSQLNEMNSFRQACQVMANFVKDMTSRGLNIRHIDLGGGLGVTYKDEVPFPVGEYCQAIKDIIIPLGRSVMVEPGRYFVANAGVLLSQVVYVKRSSVRSFVVLDSAMNDLIRPSLYDAYHTFEAVKGCGRDELLETYDIVGPVCESGDTFATERQLPAMVAGDLVACRSAGAYSMVMSSTYNARLLPAEVMVKDDQVALVRDRQNYDELFSKDKLPNWF